MNPMIANLEKLVGGPRDGALLRLSLGNAWLAQDAVTAAEHYRAALGFDADYSAAWKGLGKALEQSGDDAGALAAYRNGIATADKRGDRQAGKEMTVFVRRIEKRLEPPPDR
jgi:predicted TPR repeat methyltransferase